MVDVIAGGFCRMNPHFNRVVFRREPEGIKAHRVKHIVAVHPEIAAVNVGSGITLGVSHMQPLIRWVREHIKHITPLFFWKRWIFGGLKSFIVFPVFLPFGFYCLKGIFHTV